jgi:hypothetical protein
MPRGRRRNSPLPSLTRPSSRFERNAAMNSHPQAAPTVPKRRWFDRRKLLTSEVAQHRTTAFVYGNILVLAAVVQVSLHEITGRSVVTVLATAVTTFLAHVFAGVITSTWSWRAVLREARDSAPILTSGIIPAALLLLAPLVGFPSSAAVLLAELLLVARIASVGIVVARLRNEPTSASTVLAGVALALLALIIVVTKAVLTH